MDGISSAWAPGTAFAAGFGLPQCMIPAASPTIIRGKRRSGAASARCTASRRAKPELAQNFVDDGLDRCIDRYRYRLLFGCGRFQRGELACQQPGRHEVTLAVVQPLRDQRMRAKEVDDADVAAPVHENLAVGSPQRRAGDHRVLTSRYEPIDLGGNRPQPRPTIF